MNRLSEATVALCRVLWPDVTWAMGKTCEARQIFLDLGSGPRSIDLFVAGDLMRALMRAAELGVGITMHIGHDHLDITIDDGSPPLLWDQCIDRVIVCADTLRRAVEGAAR